MVRKDGRLEPSSWDHAISVAAESLRGLRSAGRPLGVLGSGRASNEENFLTAALARTALGTGHVDVPLRAPYEHLLRGLGADSGIPRLVSSLSQLAESDLIVLLEGDLATTHPRAAFAILQALRRGGRLVTLGWSPTRMSRLASAHLSLPPADPLQPLRELVDRVQGGGAAAGSPTPAQEVASWLLASRRPALVLGFPQERGAPLEAAAALLARAVRESGKTGDRVETFVPLPVRANSRGAREMGVSPHHLPGCRPLDDAAARDRLRKAWGAEPSRAQGLPAGEMLGAVAGLVVVAEDPPASASSRSGAMKALESLETLVVLDSLLTPTAGAARVVLPIAAFGEGWGTVTNLEGRVQACRPLAQPAGEAREGWTVLADLLTALDASCSLSTYRDVFEAVRVAVPEYGSLDFATLEEGLGAVVPGTAPRGGPGPASTQAGPDDRAGAITVESGHWLVRTEGAFEWGDDPLMRSSPTLRRDHASFRKLHPEGLVWMSPEEAKAVGVREGWKLRVRSPSGEAEVPVSLRAGLPPGLLLIPYTFRDELREVLGGADAAEVQLSRS